MSFSEITKQIADEKGEQGGNWEKKKKHSKSKKKKKTEKD